MQLPLYQIDAFTDSVFSGNPAAICPLDAWLDDTVMQAIAAENNLSETAFFVKEGEGYRLRWFTPACEVDLCGHATLATASLLLTRLTPEAEAVTFETQSGRLTVRRDGDLLVMDFPSRPATPAEPDDGLFEALGAAPREVLSTSGNALLVYADEDDVLRLRPDMSGLKKATSQGVIATASGTECDFVSRYFAPSHGIDEDPVTGSAHCTLVPYWAARLGKTDLVARQVSARGGTLYCRAEGNRVRIAGRAAFYLKGEITI